MRTELQEFVRHWERETAGTIELLLALPPDRYDFRPDAGGRSLGELAWHIAEADAYVTLGIEQGRFEFPVKPAHIQRPKTVAALAPAFRLVHEDAVARVARLKPEDWDREVAYVDGAMWTVGELLTQKLLLHSIHHRGQLMVLTRLAGGVPPGLFGRTREETARQQATA